MILINLLPHREAKKKARKTAFFVLLGAAAVAAALALVFGYLVLNGMLDNQNNRNRYIEAKNKELDTQIKDIVTLRAEIESLRARQRAVEDLQADRNVPVHLFNELVKKTPEGIFLKDTTQTGQSVNVVGYAQSQERVSDFLRNISSVNSQWLERPDLVRIELVTVGGNSKTAKKLYEFNLKFAVKRPRDKEAKAPEDGVGGAVVPGSAISAPLRTASGTKA